MDTFSVWAFPTPGGAEDARAELAALALRGEVHVDDAATLSWPAGRRKPTVRALGAITGPGALWNGFWGLLLGLVFLVPIAGLAFGAAAGTVTSGLSIFGITDGFVRELRTTVVPGTSALIILSGAEAADRLGEAFSGSGPQLVRSDLTEDQQAQLMLVLADDRRVTP